jgi:1-acyl-sn-glycerol-3-phosphate acyltransferase
VGIQLIDNSTNYAFEIENECPRERAPIPTSPSRAPHLHLIKNKPEVPKVLTKRDPEAIRQAFPWIAALADHYYRADIEGGEYLSDKASLIVTTHNGGIAMPDLYSLFVAYFRRFGLETAVYGLGHKAAFRIPVLGPMLEKFGAIPANRENGRIVLRHDYPLVVCPGGDVDCLQPYAQRHEICFGSRRGFIRLAIQEQVPVIPVVSVGAHETMFILNDGEKLARKLRIDKLLRVKTVPIGFGFPNGLNIAGLGTIPLPAKIKLRVLPPIFFREPPAAAEDKEVVERCFQIVRREMQRTLTDMAAQRRSLLFG